ncbi:MAG: hypothetical protein IJ225_10480 [Solobacterium sp.]|nr:hypothetical protein [Solobacterium sp.]
MADDAILEMVKDSLHMSFDLDDSSARRLNNEIGQGIAYIQRYGDPSASCLPGTVTGQLLCEYVLRAESGAVETFYTDFRNDILSLKAESDARAYAEAVYDDQD